MEQAEKSNHISKFNSIKKNDFVAKVKNKLPEDRAKLFALIFIVVALPLTIILALSQQNLFSRASGLPATPATPPNPTENSISWGTNSVLLSADNFYIEVDGKRFTAPPNASVVSSSNSLNSQGYYTTTLEGSWQEDGVEMRMNLYFRYRTGQFWELYEIRTYDGTQNDKWLYYTPLDEFGQPIQNSVGDSYVASDLDFYSNENSESNISGRIHFTNVAITPFIDISSQTSPTPSPSPLPTNTPTPTQAISIKTVTLSPSADGFVRSSQPSKNFGKEQTADVLGNPINISFFRFNLKSLAGKTIVKATLELNVANRSVDVVSLRRADDKSWSEAGLTYNNKPSFVGTIRTFTPNQQNQKVQLQVTNAVNAKKGGNVTFGLTSTGGDKAIFNTREASANLRPRLIIEYR